MSPPLPSAAILVLASHCCTEAERGCLFSNDVLRGRQPTTVSTRSVNPSNATNSFMFTGKTKYKQHEVVGFHRVDFSVLFVSFLKGLFFFNKLRLNATAESQTQVQGQTNLFVFFFFPDMLHMYVGGLKVGKSHSKSRADFDIYWIHFPPDTRMNFVTRTQVSSVESCVWN